MLRLVLAVLATITSLGAQAVNYQDWWSDTSVAGSSLNVAQQGSKIFIAWYMYGANSQPTWLIGVGDLQGTAARLSLSRATGPFLGPQSAVAVSSVGTATLNFTSNSTGTFSYEVDGTSGSFNVSRFSYWPINASGTYLGGSVYTQRSCSNSSWNGTYAETYSFSVSYSGNSVTLSTQGDSNCTYNGSYSQAGTRLQAGGNFSCTNGGSGTWSAEDIVYENDSMIVRFRQTFNEVGCVVTGRLLGAKWQAY